MGRTKDIIDALNVEVKKAFVNQTITLTLGQHDREHPDGSIETIRDTVEIVFDENGVGRLLVASIPSDHPWVELENIIASIEVSAAIGDITVDEI